MKASLASTLCSVVLGSVLLAPAWGQEPGASLAGGTGPAAAGPTDAVSAPPPGPGFPPGGYPPAGGYVPPIPYERDGAVIMQDGMPFGMPLPFGPMVIVEGVAGDGLGYEGNYMRFDAFLPRHVVPGRSLFFTSLAGSVTDEGDFAGNFGGGFRTIGWANRLYGVSGWYDIDDGHLDTFHRTGLSLESLGRYFDMRFNAYWVLNSSPQQELSDLICNPVFGGNSIFFTQELITETPYDGYEVEMGGLLPVLGKYGFSGFLGGYYMQGEDSKDAVGWSMRFHVDVNDSTAVGVRHTDDDVFGGNTWVNVALTLPGAPNTWFKPRKVSDRLGMPVERLDRIAARLEVDEVRVAALNPFRPGDGDDGGDGAFVVIHVDPNRGPGGSGTFEDPFGTLEEARLANNERVDIILVRPRVDDTGINLDVTDPFGLFDDQRFLSTTRGHLLVFTQFPEDCPLPDIGPIGGLGPLISNNSIVPESVVLLADNNEVAGFRIDGRPDVGTGAPVGDPLHDGIRGQGDITDFIIVGNTFQNLINGVVLTASGTGIFSENLIDGTGSNGISMNRGFSVTTTTGGTLDVFISENASQNVQGLNEDANNNGVLDFGEDVNNNGVLDLGTAFEVVANGGTANVDFRLNTSTNDAIGLNLSTANGGILNATIGEILVVDGVDVIESNVFTDNTVTGIQLAGITGTINADLAGNVFTRPTGTGAGMLINTTDVDLVINLLRNEFLGGPAASFGIGGTVTGGTLALNVGDGTDDNANLFDGNGDAGIGLNLAGDAVADLQVFNNQFLNSIDGPDPNFDGDGMRFRVLDTARVLGTSLITGNTIDGNAGRGVGFLATSFAVIEGIEVVDNVITGNGLNGVEFFRDGSATIGNVADRVLIADNLIDGNTDGINLVASNQNTTDFYQVEDNQITNNTSRGVSLRVEADADLDVNLERNIISNNGSHGVQLTEDLNTATDSRSVTGIWVSNVITGNGGHGISSDAATANLRVGLNGVDGAGRSLGNLIADNGLDGVSITGPGSATYTNNEITGNGVLSGNGLDGHGVDIAGAGFKFLVFEDNFISDNRGDGIEFQNNGNSGGFAFTLLTARNEITFNDGRGIDVLNQGNADSFVSIVDSDISFNGEEGIYVVNTASTAQNQAGPAPTTANPSVDPTHGMDATGSIFADPRLRLIVDGNFIDGNGRPLVGGGGSTFPGTGLVIRVGTSDGGYGFQNDGGFASDGAGNQINGGVLADVVDNSFSGNFGDDLFFESFTSTVDPPTTAGTWNATTFDVDNYEGDPLARMDLTFTGNSFDSSDANNLGAFYDNAEAVFKSRDTAQTDPGPFAVGGTRRRNAQRLGDRDDVVGLLPPATPGGQSDTFLYPGMGESTFRVNAISDLAPFILDDQPYLNHTDANGVLLQNAQFGELPYGWSLFP